MKSVISLVFCCVLLALGSITRGQYISADAYTRYELLAPETNSFRIFYEVTETRPGARFHFNIIRPGSEASDEAVYDLATGKPLKFEVVTGAQAKADSPSENFTPDAHYIKVQLAHPVPARGEYRLRIDKTYKDKQSYYSEDDHIVFKRGLGIPRNSVVLPVGYEIVSSSVAAQVITEADGRLKLAFVNPGSGGQLEVNIVARRLSATTEKKVERRTASVPVAGLSTQLSSAPQSMQISERAYQDREILYELQEPSSHAFRITHDYTERKEGTQHYFNIVRAGSHVSEPESTDLDNGENLKWETLSGKQVKTRKLPLNDVQDDAEVVVTFLAQPVAKGASTRLRLKETYTDAKSYYLDGDELIWDRTFGRLRNTVVLPPGWYLTGLASPATIQTLRDGRVSVYVVNPRNDDVRVYLRARRRAAR
jgi:hypothetical protein